MNVCPYCKNPVEEGAKKCFTCNRGLEKTIYINTSQSGKGSKSCFRCGKYVNKPIWAKNQQYCETCINTMLDDIKMTTTNDIEGYKIIKYLGIDTAEVVIGTGIFSEFITELQDFMGERSTLFEIQLAKAKYLTFKKIKLAALDNNANAIVGIDIDYTEFTGNRIGIIVSGTLVEIEKNN